MMRGEVLEEGAGKEYQRDGGVYLNVRSSKKKGNEKIKVLGGEKGVTKKKSCRRVGAPVGGGESHKSSAPGATGLREEERVLL